MYIYMDNLSNMLIYVWFVLIIHFGTKFDVEKINLDQFGDSKSIGLIFNLIGFANLIIS